MKEGDSADRISQALLAKRGYGSVESQAIGVESGDVPLEDAVVEVRLETDTGFPNAISFHALGETSPDIYESEYGSLKRWIDESLDLYKVGVFHIRRCVLGSSIDCVERTPQRFIPCIRSLLLRPRIKKPDCKWFSPIFLSRMVH